MNLNRNFIGMELTEQYFEIAKERIEKARKMKDEQKTEEKATKGDNSTETN